MYNELDEVIRKKPVARFMLYRNNEVVDTVRTEMRRKNIKPRELSKMTKIPRNKLELTGVFTSAEIETLSRILEIPERKLM